MKSIFKRLSIVFALVLVFAAMFAISVYALTSYVNTTYSTNYFYGDTDKDPMTYTVGETMTFTVSLKSSTGDLVSVPYFSYSFSGDDGISTSGKVNGSTGTFTVTHKITCPGFVRLTVKALDSNGSEFSTVRFQGGACADWQNIKTAMAEPDDFDEYWERTLGELDEVFPSIYDLKLDTANTDGSYNVYDLYVNAPGSKNFLNTAAAGEEPNGATYMAGKLTVPKNIQPGQAKFYLGFQGAGVYTSPGVSKNAGYVTLCVYAHSIEMSREQSYYDNLNKGLLSGYMKRALYNDNAEESYTKYMILRDLQAVRFLKTFFDEGGDVSQFNGIDVSAWKGLWNGKDIEIYGQSQGGFQCIAVAALDHDISLCQPWVACWCDMYAKTYFPSRRTMGLVYEHYSQKYFDSVALGKRIVCKTRVYTGFGDDTCPTTGVVAAYNEMTCNKQLIIYQGMEHNCATNYASGVSKQKYTSEVENFKVPYNWTYTFDWEIASVDGSAFELLSDGKTVKAVGMGTATVTFADGRHYPIVVETETAIYDLIFSDGVLTQDMVDGFAKSIYARTAHTAYAGLAWSDLSAEISAGKIIKGRTYFVISNLDNDKVYDADDMYSLYKASGADYLVMIPGASIDTTDIAMYAMQLNQDKFANAFVCNNGAASEYQAGRNAGNNIVSIIEKNKPVLDADYKIFAEGGEELNTLSVIGDGEKLSLAVVFNDVYNSVNGAEVFASGIDFDSDSMTVTGDSDGGSIFVNSKEFIVYPDAIAYGNEEGYSWFIGFDGTLTVFADGALSDSSYPWASYVSDIKNVNVAVGVTDVPSGAFSDMVSLKSITLPYTLKKIADDAVTGASDYVVYGYESNAPSMSFATANGVEFSSLGACGYAGASLMWEYRDGVLYITGNGKTVESGCAGYQQESTSAWYKYYNQINKVVICDGVTAIGSYCFYNMKALTQIEIPASLRTINNGAFMASAGLSSIYIRGNEPKTGVIDLSTVTSIVGGYHFDSGAVNATTFILSDNLTGSIGGKFLTTNKAMTELTIPAGVTNLANRSISGNSALKKLIVLGNNTTISGDALAYNETNSTKLDIIYGRIGSPAASFAQEKGIKFADLTGDRYDGEVSFSGDCGTDVYFKLVENENADTYTLYFYGTGTDIVSGNTATALNAPWSAYADDITRVVYRGNIESMGAYNLVGLTNLEAIELDECAFTDICANAFAGVGFGGTFEISEEVTSIATNAFAGATGLNTVIICNSKTEINANAFAGCSVSTVYGYYGSTAQTFASTAGATFKNINEYLPVATGYLEAWHQGAKTVNTKWTYVKSERTLYFESLTSAGAWNECGNTSYGTDNKIAWSIFKNEIEKVVIGANLKKVSGSAFKDHTALKVVEIPASVGQIDNNAFNGCTSLDTIYINGYVPVKGVADLHCVTNLDGQADIFVGCAFDKVVFNASEDSIKEGSFRNSAVKTVIGNSSTTAALAESIGASVVKGYSEGGMLWTVDGETLTVYASDVPTAVSAFGNLSDSVTKIVFESESTIKTLNTGVFDVFTNLEEVLFKCNAPETASPACFGTGNVIVYYAKGISTFTSPNWNGYTCLEEGSTLGIVASGQCKADGYFWALDDLGTLTISGEGNGYLSFTKTPNYNALDNLPWYSYLAKIKKVVIKEETKITKVVQYALSNLPNCTTMIIPTTLTDLGSEWNVLCNNPSLKTIAVQGNEVVEGVIDLRNVTKLNYQLFEGSFTNTKPTIYLAANPEINVTNWANACEELTIVTYPTSNTATLFREIAKKQASSSPNAKLPKKVVLKYYTAEQDVTLVRSGSQSANNVAFDWSFDDATGTLTFTKPANALDWNELCFNANSYAKPFYNWMAIWKDAIIHVNVASTFSKFQLNGDVYSPFKDCYNLVSFKYSGGASIEWQCEGKSGYFEGCSSLTTFGMSTSFNEGVIDLSGIGKFTGSGSSYNSMFKNCSSVTSVKFRTNTLADGSVAYGETIASNMFAGCTSLRSIEIPSRIKTINANAFEGCTSLKSVTLNSLPTIAAKSAFPDNEGQALYIHCPDQATADAVNALGYTYTKAVYIDLGNLSTAIEMEGYVVRLKSYNGLRGLFSFNNSVITTNKESGFELVEYGALLASQKTYNKYGVELALVDGEYVTPSKGVIKTPVYMNGEQVGKILNTSTDEITKFAASITKYTSNFKTNVYICGYEIWETADGERIIVYTDCSDDNYDFTNLYQISLNLYKNGLVNGENDEEGIVWGILSANGAVTLKAGTDYNYSDGQTDLDGNSLADQFVFRDVPAVYQTTSSNNISFAKSNVTITLLEDGANYVAVYRGEGAVPSAYPWDKIGSSQISANFCGALVLTKLPNPKLINASKIKTVILDYGVNEVQNGGLSQVHGMETMVYSSSLKKLGDTMFVSCSSLSTAYLADVNNPNFDFKANLIDFSGLDSVKAHYMFVSAKKVQYVRLPAEIGTSAKGMFNNDTLVKGVSCGTAELVDGVIDMSQTGITGFGDYSFAYVNNITTLKLPATVTTFFDKSGTTERHAFASNSSNGTSACGIRTIITENEVKTISDYVTTYGEAMKLTYTWTNK